MRDILLKHRVYVGIALGVLVAVASLIVYLVASSNPPSEPGASATPPTAGPTTSQPMPSAIEYSLELGEIVATINGEELEVFASPEDAESVLTLGKWSAAAFQPLTLLAINTADVDGESWLQVMLPVQPNNSTGWIREADVTVTSTSLQIHIYLDERELDLTESGTVVLTADVAIGTDETPTPPGIYSVTDRLEYLNPDHAYGAFALGLSGFSEVLDSFQGAPPQLAIHGTNRPQLIGDRVSNGCIRLHDDVVSKLAEYAQLGTPVIIHQSRELRLLP